jgi:hypothetical protein
MGIALSKHNCQWQGNGSWTESSTSCSIKIEFPIRLQESRYSRHSWTRNSGLGKVGCRGTYKDDGNTQIEEQNIAHRISYAYISYLSYHTNVFPSYRKIKIKISKMVVAELSKRNI